MAPNEYDMSFSFITFTDQSSIKDPAQQQLARTQAIKFSLQRKRRSRQLARKNFVDETASSIVKHQKSGQEDYEQDAPQFPRRSASLAVGIIDPFQTLSVDAGRLTTLLQDRSARQAGEPVFSFNNGTDHMALKSVFNAGFDDPALAFALCLTLAFTANGGVMDEECSTYRLKAIQRINEKLSDPTKAVTSTTVGTVLLLVGVEGRLGQRETAQIHLNGARQLLLLCNQQHAYLNHAIKRAIFWQDVFSAVIVGTDRVVSHETFPEIHWHRDPFQGSIYTTPAGFARCVDVIGQDFLDIAEDIRALQRLREDGNCPLSVVEVEKIDNQQAWIESRLQVLRGMTSEPLLLCCIPAAYLCAYGVFSEVWDADLIPARVSSQLLRLLETYETEAMWDDHPDVLLWLLNIGTAFSTDDTTKLGFARLLHDSHRARLEPIARTWTDIRSHLHDFIWCDCSFGPRCQELWGMLAAIIVDGPVLSPPNVAYQPLRFSQ